MDNKPNWTTFTLFGIDLKDIEANNETLFRILREGSSKYGFEFEKELVQYLRDLQVSSPQPYDLSLFSTTLSFRHYYFLITYLVLQKDRISRLEYTVSELEKIRKEFMDKIQRALPDGINPDNVSLLLHHLEGFLSKQTFFFMKKTEIFRGILLLNELLETNYILGSNELKITEKLEIDFPYVDRIALYSILFGGICTLHPEKLGFTIPIVSPDHLQEYYHKNLLVCIKCSNTYLRPDLNLLEGIPPIIHLKSVRDYLTLSRKVGFIDFEQTEQLVVEYITEEFGNLTPKILLKRLVFNIKFPEDLIILVNGEHKFLLDDLFEKRCDKVETIEFLNHKVFFLNYFQLGKWNSLLLNVDNDKLKEIIGTGSVDDSEIKELIENGDVNTKQLAITFGASEELCHKIIHEEHKNLVYNAAIAKMEHLDFSADRFLELARLHLRKKVYLSYANFNKIIDQIVNEKEAYELIKMLDYSDEDSWDEVRIILRKITSLELLQELYEMKDDEDLHDQINSRIKMIR